jgi:hypothetical protein
MSWVWSGVPLDVDSVGCIVNSIASDVGRSVCWSVSHKVGWSISYNVGSGVDRLHYFVFSSTFFNHRVEGTQATTLLARTLQSASGVGSCCGFVVSGTSFFDLSSGDVNIGLKTSYHRRIFKVT